MKRKLAKSSKEFDHCFDAGEDIHDLIEMSQAKVIHHGKKVRITLDIAESLVTCFGGGFHCCFPWQGVSGN